MNRAVKLILSIIMGVLGVLFLNKEYPFLSYNIPYFSMPHGKVRVDIINHASEVIQTASINGKRIATIEVGERRTILFDYLGEGSYELEVVFASGKTMKGGEAYVEKGHFIREIVSDTSINTGH